MSTQVKETTKTETTSNTATKRKVTIISTQLNSRQTIETSASTWGELKKELPSGSSGGRAVIRETRSTIGGGSTELPNTDFTLFMYPEKVRSGRTVKVNKVTSSDWDEVGVLETLQPLKDEFDELLSGFTPSKEISKEAKETAALIREAREMEEELNM